MRDLIYDLLEYSRVGRKNTHFTDVDLNIIAQRVIEDAKTSYPEATIIVDNDLPTLQAIPIYMHQLFQNLVANAIKFRKKDVEPVIHISGAEEGSKWRIDIKDNGIGIDQQYRDRIFKVFQRLHTRDQYPGSGIGLSICKKIISIHGGRLGVESKLGEGADFYFVLPAKQYV